jgi:hypothetical protein
MARYVLHPPTFSQSRHFDFSVRAIEDYLEGDKRDQLHR